MKKKNKFKSNEQASSSFLSHHFASIRNFLFFIRLRALCVFNDSLFHSPLFIMLKQQQWNKRKKKSKVWGFHHSQKKFAEPNWIFGAFAAAWNEAFLIHDDGKYDIGSSGMGLASGGIKKLFQRRSETRKRRFKVLQRPEVLCISAEEKI